MLTFILALHFIIYICSPKSYLWLRPWYYFTHEEILILLVCNGLMFAVLHPQPDITIHFGVAHMLVIGKFWLLWILIYCNCYNGYYSFMKQSSIFSLCIFSTLFITWVLFSCHHLQYSTKKKSIILSFQITQACGKQNNLLSKPYKLYFEFLFSFSW